MSRFDNRPPFTFALLSLMGLCISYGQNPAAADFSVRSSFTDKSLIEREKNSPSHLYAVLSIYQVRLNQISEQLPVEKDGYKRLALEVEHNTILSEITDYQNRLRASLDRSTQGLSPEELKKFKEVLNFKVPEPIAISRPKEPTKSP